MLRASAHFGGSEIETVFQLLVLTRWLHFASLFLLFGCSFFWLWMGSKLYIEMLPWPVSLSPPTMKLAAVLAAVSGLGWLVVSIANMTGSFADMVDLETMRAFLFETPFGLITGARLLLLITLVAVMTIPMIPTFRFASIAVVSGLLMISQAWLGHAAEGGNTPVGIVMIAVYATHVLSAAAWAGGLPALALALAERWRRGQSGYDVLSRYSMMAMIAVGLVLLSGIANTIFHVRGSMARLMSSTYADVLVAKITLVLAMLVLAIINRMIIMPRLRVAFAPTGAAYSMRVSLSFELVLATLVLGAAAVLGITPPPQ